MTFFYKEILGLVEKKHLYIAIPPLYRISQGSKTLYARDDNHKDDLLRTEFTGKSKIDVSRFKGLGEMPSKQLKETTMDPTHRVLMRIIVPTGNSDDIILNARSTNTLVNNLMGKKPELRFEFIQKHAQFVDRNNLDV